MITRQIRVKGRVQGVGYRDALREQANRHRITGWVRNCADGSVEALLQGTPDAVEALIVWASRGPPAAHVSQLESFAPMAEHDRRFERFERWPTTRS